MVDLIVAPPLLEPEALRQIRRFIYKCQHCQRTWGKQQLNVSATGHASSPRPTPLWSTRIDSKSLTAPLIPTFTVPELHSCTGIRGERRCLPIRISGAILIHLSSHRFKAPCILVPTKLNLFGTKLATNRTFFFLLPCY